MTSKKHYRDTYYQLREFIIEFNDNNKEIHASMNPQEGNDNNKYTVEFTVIE